MTDSIREVKDRNRRKVRAVSEPDRHSKKPSGKKNGNANKPHRPVAIYARVLVPDMDHISSFELQQKYYMDQIYEEKKK